MLIIQIERFSNIFSNLDDRNRSNRSKVGKQDSVNSK